tara:strand:- start:35 stop:3268 length:3234 start_codon:yes stop_codon:yes gene_type:complete
MPPRLKNLKTLIVDYTRVFGYKPHGNNKQFKELKGNRALDTPRKKREFLDEMIDNKKQETAISKIKNIFRKSTIKKFQESFRKYTEKRKKYINDFKNKLKNNRIITLQRSEINLNSSIIQIIEIIQNQIDITKENVVIGVKNMSYTLTPENIKKLIDIAKEGGYLEEIVDGGSDNKLVYDVFTAPEIIIEKYYKSNKYKTKEGDFFTYYLKDNININLEDLQIYKKDCDDKKRNLDNCLLFSLKQYGIADEKLEKIKEMIKLKKIPISDIKIVCDKLRVGITIWFSNTNQTRKVSYGKQYDININIGYIENHYFLIKDTKYTSYSIKNYDSVKHLDDFNMIYIKTGKKSNNRFINTFELVSLMMENKDYFFDKIDAGNINKYDEIYLDKLKDNSFACLEYDINDYREVSFDKTTIEPDLEVDEKTKIVYFDFETGKIKRNGKIFVEPFLCCTIDNQDNKKSFLGKNCAYNMLNSLNQDTILIAHNAKFDYTFLTKHLWKCKEICNGSAFITFTGYFGKIKIQIKDSYKLIPMRLSEFPKAFKLDYVKEYMPYDLYTDDNINLRYIEYEAVLDYIENDNEKEIFDENIAKWDLVKDSCVDMIEYARKYCEIDVQLLRDSYNIFRDNCISHFNIDVNKILTIPTLADKYLISEGCYDGVYELSGQPRQFIQNCIVGGRTMCCNNEKNILENVRVNDFDAVSLYPSAMYRINGFLKGLPKVITNLDYNVVKNYDGYFVQIKIKKIGIDRKFGLCSYIDTDKGVRNFTNDLVGRIVYIDKTGLEDLINFQNVEFEIIKGYYFDEGFNTKINQVIKTIFDKRLQLKKEKNVGQLIYKLIMNSGYGKAIQKSHDVDTKLFDNRKDFESYLSKNYNKIKSFVKYDDDKKFKVSVGSTMTDHFNRCHIGVEILSMSKRIMNEVICLAEDNSLNIYYQDTDSIHIEDKDIAVLSALYKNKYDKDLIGNNLGQFHSDFELEGANKNIIATDSIFLGKKSYVDKLVGEDDAGNKINGFHFRMKGIPSKVVEYYCNENKITIFELYRKMYNGDMIDFDLTCGGTKFTIKHEKDYTINIIDDFRRKVCFA